MHHIAIFHDIFLSFHTQFTRLSHFCFTPVSNKIIIFNNLSTNKPLLEIGVDNSRSLRCCGSNRNGPGTNLFDTGGEIGLQV